MKKLYPFVILFSSILLVLSCQKEIDFSGQAPPGQIYANCILNPDSVLKVYVSYSIPISEPVSYVDKKLDEAYNALVIIKESNGQVLDTLELTDDVHSNVRFLVFQSIEGIHPNPSTEYTLEVSEPYRPNSKKIKQKITTLSGIFPPIDADTLSPKVQIEQDNKVFVINVEWLDPDPMDNNYYIIEAIFDNSFSDPSGIAYETWRGEIYSIDNNTENHKVGNPNSSFFYVFLQDNKLYPPGVSPPPPPPGGGPPAINTRIGVVTIPYEMEINHNWGQQGIGFASNLIIRVHQLSEDLYDYYKEVEEYRLTAGSNDIFAQPVEVRSNIQGSLGFVGSAVVREDVIKLK